MPGMPDLGTIVPGASLGGAAQRLRTYLAFDFGQKRVGVASGNTLTRSAQPLCTIAATLRARRFARQLHGRLRMQVHEVDERYTTTEAHAGGARDLDAASAALILEQYLRSESE